MRTKSILLVSGLLATVVAFSNSAQAAPATTKAAAPVATEDSSGFQAGDILVRVRGLLVSPNVYTSQNTGAFAGTSAEASKSIVPEVDATYFFTKNIAVEAIAAITPHHVKTNSGVDGGHVWLLPPTVTAQYHFLPNGMVNPYLGAGLNYTVFFGEKSGATGVNLKYKNSWNPALQAGADIRLTNNWYANVDVKQVFISTDAYTDTGPSAAHVNLNPTIVGVGIGYKF